jgi:hypothetical protein
VQPDGVVPHHADHPAAILRNVLPFVMLGARIVIGEFHPMGPCEEGAKLTSPSVVYRVPLAPNVPLNSNAYFQDCPTENPRIVDGGKWIMSEAETPDLDERCPIWARYTFIWPLPLS